MLVVTAESPPQLGAKQSCFCSLALKGFSIHNKKVINVKLPLPGRIDLKIITTIKGGMHCIYNVSKSWHAGIVASMVACHLWSSPKLIHGAQTDVGLLSSLEGLAKSGYFQRKR